MLNFFFRNRSKFFLGFVLCACVWALVYRNSHRFSGNSTAKSSALALWVPVQNLVNNVIGFPERTLNALQELRGYKEETNRLRLENQTLRLELSNHKSLQAQLERLKTVLQLKSTFPRQAKIARIIAHDPTTWNKSFVVDIGSEDDVLPDSPVLSEQGIVGRVLETTPHYSRVLMLTDMDSGVAGIDVRSRVTGIILGTGQTRLKYGFVSSGEDIQTGDTIVSSGLGGVFPRGYALGTVIKKIQKENALNMDVELVPSVDLGALDYVFILPPISLY